METPAKTDIYQFGEFRLDASNRLLWLGEKQISLTPKEFEVLFALVENAGRVLTKDELLETIWTDTFVEEATLARNVSWLRKKLSANRGAENFIETLPKRGYRFAGVVTKISEAAKISEPPRAVFIEERTLTRIAVEESFIVEDSAQNIASERSPIAALPAPVESRHRYFGLLWLASGIAAAAVALVLYQNFFRVAEPKIIVAARVAPFSGLAGRENFPAFSPDGKLLTYVWNGGAGENFDVYVKQIGAGAPVRLTDTTVDEIYPTFSPDGSRVAFVRMGQNRSEVFIVPALGGAERKICDLAVQRSRLSFSPDGRFLLAADADAANTRTGIFSIDAATGAKRRLTAPPENTTDNSPRLSPDGSKLAFLRNFNSVSDELFVVSLAGGAPEQQLTSEKITIPGLAWTADGKKIILAMRANALASNLRQISVDDGKSELIMTGGNVTNPAISADGRKISYVEEFYRMSIWQLENNSPDRKLIESSRDDHSPNFSPDGARIAFVSSRTGNQEIWICAADGKNQRQLTDSLHLNPENRLPENASPNTVGSPRFSPDGKFIAFDAQVGGNSDIFIISSDGGAARRLTSEASQEILPAWSANGAEIFFNSNRGGDSNLWKMPLAGGEAVQVTKHGAFESYAAPDGKTVFYTKSGSENGLRRVSAGGGEKGEADEQALPNLAEVGSRRYWTMTKSGVYYLAPGESPPYKIRFYDFSTLRTNDFLASDKSPIWTYPGLSAAPDGKTILYAQSDQNASSILIAELEK